MEETATLLFREGVPQDWQRAAQAIASAYPGATLADAGRAVRAGNGFLELNLPGEALVMCREALRRAGFECEVIPSVERASPARPVFARRLRLGDALEVVEPPAEPLDWPGVALLHVARVQPKALGGEGLGVRDAAEASALGVASAGMLVGVSVPMSTVARAANKAEAGRTPQSGAPADLYCDLCHADGRRVRLRMGAFTYDCLSPPVAALARDNFARLLRELASRAKGAVLSPAMQQALSAQSLMRFGEPTSEEDYERQIVWLLTRERVWPSVRSTAARPSLARGNAPPGGERGAGPGEAGGAPGAPGRAPQGPRAGAARRPALPAAPARQAPEDAGEVRYGVSRGLFWARSVFVALLVISAVAFLLRPSPEESRSNITGATMKAGPLPHPKQVEWPPLGPVKAGTPLIASATTFRLELRWSWDFPETKRTAVFEQLAESSLPGYRVRQRNAGGAVLRGLWRSLTLQKAAEPADPPALDYEHVRLEPIGKFTAELLFAAGAIPGKDRDGLEKSTWGTVLDVHLDSTVSVHAVKVAEEAVAEAARQLGAWVRDPAVDQVLPASVFANSRVATWEGGVPDVARHSSIVHVSGGGQSLVEVRGLRKFGLPVIQLEVPDGLRSERARLVARVLAQTLMERPAPTRDGELVVEVDALTHEGVTKALREELPPEAPGTLVLSASLQKPGGQEPILRVSWPADARGAEEAFFGAPPAKP